MSVLCGLFGLLVVASWIGWQRKPRAELRVTPQEITYRRGETVSSRFLRRRDTKLVMRRNRSGQFLAVVGDDKAVISLMGFDLGEVGRACSVHGWALR